MSSNTYLKEQMETILTGAKVELGRMPWFQLQLMKRLVSRLKELGWI